MAMFSALNRALGARRSRLLLDNLTAYLFLAPAGLLILLFGIFPVAFAFFVSLHRWRRFPDHYVGLANYEKALGNLGYILFFWLALLAFAAAAMMAKRLLRTLRTSNDDRRFASLLAGLLCGYAALLAIDWLFKLIPVIMLIPRQVRGQNTSLALFMEKLGESFSSPAVAAAGNLLLGGLIVTALVIALVAWRFRSAQSAQLASAGGITTVLLISASFLLQLTVSETEAAIAAARETGESLPIWSQLVFISAGLALIAAAWLIFRRGIKTYENRRFAMLLVGGLMLAVGGYLLMAEAPAALAAADDDLLQGFWITIMYAMGTVPVQLSIGLLLAYLLFQPIRFRAFFRMVYFIPYITPFVATSIVFRIIFEAGKHAPANRIISLVGIEPQRWILERSTIGGLLGLPDFLAGPSLALIVIMIYSTWTYIGYDAVIFLAGLGNIPGELYEAARIDGASGWRIFRHITLPLLSPTVFFLSLVAIIGTFQAFTQIWILRTGAVGNRVNTASVYIFDELQNSNRYGYASSMAFVLFALILLMTLFQNRIMGRRVFYG
ncbi:MAG: ABC transporter permease subunit [Chloroflexota bacterium]|nr:ABC transporter permease subunit [Chloroflexota bacterium]MDE2948499.1 ABC transporter permease subunit [Chloroflexota bacterium]